MSFLRRLMPRLSVDSSFTAAASLLGVKLGVVFLSRVSLHSRTFSLLDTLLTQACMEESSGEEIDVSALPPLPSSEREKKNTTLSQRYEILQL